MPHLFFPLNLSFLKKKSQCRPSTFVSRTATSMAKQVRQLPSPRPPMQKFVSGTQMSRRLPSWMDVRLFLNSGHR